MTAATLLYIDDDEGLRRLAVRALGRRGYAVTTAGSGLDGVALARERRFDLIAVDHYMPGMDGLATLGLLSALPQRAPVIYVTGSEETRVAVAAMKAGAADYVIKTVGDDFFDLLATAADAALKRERLRADKEAAEHALRASNARLEALLREVNHRVANSLQLVSAFVHLQARSLPDTAARTALEDTQRRIAAIAQVHRRLYTSGDVESVAMDDYLAALVAELQETWSTPEAERRLTLAAEPIRLDNDKAVSLGVIVNELVSNACKYAYPPAQPGEIRLRFARDGDRHFRLEVEDDGVGFDATAEPQGTGIGGKLIQSMARSLRAELDYVRLSPGMRATLRAAV